jgi:hypothetical protein
MEGQGSGDAQLFKLIVYVAAGFGVAYVVVLLGLMIACMLSVACIAGFGYLGYRLAVDPTLWQLRKAQQAAQRKQEWELHKHLAPPEIHGLMDSYFLDQAEEPYKPKSVSQFEDALDKAKKVISTFRKREK